MWQKRSAIAGRRRGLKGERSILGHVEVELDRLVLVVAFELLQEVLDRDLLSLVDHRVRFRHLDGFQLVGRHANMDVGQPDVAIFGLLVPHVEHVVGGPVAGRLLEAYAFADARHGDGLDGEHRLVGLVLNFDIDHEIGPA